ncbi:MAG: hypothetical protein A2508_00515 [Candidatus Lambdaproteobacteria bacterium RIFOXYD12_FULL_49_8]|nr:MAG: hypothetical protein A2508_00515 [Candidatus Lambdaproteobacteria bacterium RIFOXYD12_FULL_49_8]
MVQTPEPPYWLVSFSSLSGIDREGYAVMATQMEALVQKTEGFLGMESISSPQGSITLSYWRDLDSIKAWKMDLLHQEAQREGQNRWYQNYQIRIAQVERQTLWQRS